MSLLDRMIGLEIGDRLPADFTNAEQEIEEIERHVAAIREMMVPDRWYNENEEGGLEALQAAFGEVRKEAGLDLLWAASEMLHEARVRLELKKNERAVPNLNARVERFKTFRETGKFFGRPGDESTVTQTGGEFQGWYHS